MRSCRRPSSKVYPEQALEIGNDSASCIVKESKGKISKKIKPSDDRKVVPEENISEAGSNKTRPGKDKIGKKKIEELDEDDILKINQCINEAKQVKLEEDEKSSEEEEDESSSNTSSSDLTKKHPDGMNSILTPEEIKRYGKMERRIQILGCNCKVVENLGKGSSLFRAIAQGVAGDEDCFAKIQEKILDYITKEEFTFYKEDLLRAYLEVMPALTNLSSDDKICNGYTKYLRNNMGPATMMELHAAGILYGFNFAVLVFWKNVDFFIVNCNDPKLKEYPLKLYFFLSGETREKSHYELLLPMGEFVEPPDGIHEVSLKLVMQVPHLEHMSPKVDSKAFVPSIPQEFYKILFTVDNMEFLYQKSKSHNLLEILAEKVYGSVSYKDVVKVILNMSREDLNVYLDLRQASNKIQRDVGATNRRNQDNKKHQEHHRVKEDMTYLKLAVTEFEFSTMVIGMDSLGDLYTFKSTYYNKEEDMLDSNGNSKEIPWYYFFVRDFESKPKWYLLGINTIVADTINKVTNVDPDDVQSIFKIQQLYRKHPPLRVYSEDQYTLLREDLKKKYLRTSHREELNSTPSFVKSISTFLNPFKKQPSTNSPRSMLPFSSSKSSGIALPVPTASLRSDPEVTFAPGTLVKPHVSPDKFRKKKKSNTKSKSPSRTSRAKGRK